jgi:hypothetical protein
MWHKSEFLKINKANHKLVLCSQEEDYDEFKDFMFKRMQNVETELDKVSK